MFGHGGGYDYEFSQIQTSPKAKEHQMAKDGTMRGGRRAGAGAKKKPLIDKLADGNTGHRPTKVITLPTGNLPDGAEMPKPKEFLSRKQADGKKFQAKRIYAHTWEWLSRIGIAHLVNPDSIERYSMSAARWIQCEEAISQYGLLSKHPTTGEPIATPFFNMAEKYKSAMARDWAEIYTVVKDNCSGDYSQNPHDEMESLFRRKSL